MYTPKDFKIGDRAATLALIRSNPFGMLVSVANGEPCVTHVPFSIAQTEPVIVLSAHVAKANPHWHSLDGARVLVVFSGPHGYISPRWYTKPPRNVPTWNYTVVHCSGIVEIASEDTKRAVLAQLVTEMESSADQPWSIDAMDREYRDAQLQHIVAFRVTVDTIQAKFKLSQNRALADRTGAIAGLRELAGDANRALADAMSNPPNN